MGRKEQIGYWFEGTGGFPPSGYMVYNEHGPKLPITPLEALVWELERDGLSCQDARIYAESLIRERMTPARIVQKLRFKQAAEEATPKLSELEHFVLTRRFGLDGNIPVTQKRAGNEVGLSAWSISRIERRAIEKLRPYYRTPNR